MRDRDRRQPSRSTFSPQYYHALVRLVKRAYLPFLLAISVMLLLLGTTRNSMVTYDATSDDQSPVLVHHQGAAIAENRPVSTGLKACPLLPEELGLIGEVPVNKTAPTWAELETMFPDTEPGGRWRPPDCIARSRMAIVVPYRDRDYNLRAFLQHMHRFLRRQKLEYGIIVAEQAGNTTFNRGLTRNIGFHEANLYGEYDCTVFNDVDLLPENDMNSYGCPDMPRHMCISLDYFDYKPIASGAIFGGIVAFRNDHFMNVNGYSNLYFGWGGEDDDLMARCKKSGMGFYRARPQYGRYQGTEHKKDHRIRTTYKLWRYRDDRVEIDGLNTLEYKVLAREKRSLYTWVLADVDEAKYQDVADKYLAHMDSIPRNNTAKAKQTKTSDKKKTVPKGKTVVKNTPVDHPQNKDTHPKNAQSKDIHPKNAKNKDIHPKEYPQKKDLKAQEHHENMDLEPQENYQSEDIDEENEFHDKEEYYASHED